MKKIFAFVMMLSMGWMTMMAECQDGPYGLQINGNKVVDAPKFGDPDFEGRIQYKASCVSLQAGDEVKLINQSCGDTWMIDLDPYGDYANFEGGKEAGKVTCKVAGSYDFYIKLSMEKGDLIYVELGKDCGGQGGGDNPGGQGGGDNPGGQGGGADEDVNYYAIGWINGADHGEAAYDTFEDEYMFENGKLTIDCKMGSYIAVKDHMGNFYYAEGNSNATGNTVTLKWANGWTPCQKWAILEGTQYIIIREATFKGNIVLETVDKATYDAYSWGGNQAVENVQTSEKAHKVMMDGQLYIMYNGTKYNVQGAEVK